MASSNSPLISNRFPYLPLTLTVQGGSLNVEAILDTGFDGEVVIPQYTLPPWVTPDGLIDWTMANGATVQASAYSGTVLIGHFGPFNVTISSMGNVALIGRALTDLFTIILDHGKQVIVTL